MLISARISAKKGKDKLDKIRIIKKYPNRRLYDTEIGVYITLNDIKKLVYDRIKFKVVDAKTKKDLTQITLLQIIADEETKSQPIFTNELLEDFIRSYQENTQHIFSEFLEQTMNLFNQQKSFLENQWEFYREFFSSPKFTEQLKKFRKEKNK